MHDDALTAASWDYPLGTSVSVVSSSGRRMVVVITDRGPSKALYHHGRILDLSPAAFQALAPLTAGVIPVILESVTP